MGTQVQSEMRLQRFWRAAARLAWIAAFALAIGLWAMGSFEQASEPPTACARVDCDPFELSAKDMEMLRDLDLPVNLIVAFWTVTNAGIALVFFAIALVIFWRTSGAWMGLLASFTLVYLGAVFFTESDDALWRTHVELRGWLAIVYALGYSTSMLFLLYFPDGKSVPRSRRLDAVVITLILLIAPFTVNATRGDPLAVILLVGTVCIGVAAQIHRYRRVSGPLQRQQTKWVVLGLLSSVVVIVVWVFTKLTLPPDQPSVERIGFLVLTRPVLTFVIPLLPLTIAFSILRYRLFDIDVIINRSLVYGTLTGTLALAYFISVILIQELLRVLTGQASQLAIVASTLAIAALFNPLRRRIQNDIDRRFYRRKYDAQQVLAAFAETARDETNLDRLTDELVSVVEETMQPAHVSLWLRPANDIRPRTDKKQ